MAEENLGTAVLSIVVDSKGLEESLNKAKQQIQKTSQELQRSLTAAPVNPATGKTYAQERAYKTALAVSKELLDTDLKREQALRRISQRILESAKVSQGGFGEFSATVGRDPIAKAIRRNQDRLAQQEAARTAERQAQRDRISERRAQVRSLQTAGGGGLTTFLRDIRQREEGEKRITAERTKGYKQAEQREAKLLAATQKRQKEQLAGAIGSGLIGGGFPLLFGQGAGAAVGGGIGGALGGAVGGQFGFALSIVGTAVGAQIDVLTQRFTELGNALNDPIANFEQFIEKATLASKAQESLAKALQETGQTAAAADLIRNEALRTIDPIAAQGAASAQDKFNRTLSDTQDVLGTIVSGPARGFLNFLTDTLRAISGPTPPVGETPAEQRTRITENARRRSGGGIGAAVTGVGLVAGGLLAVPTGVGSLPGAIAVGTGASLIAGGLASSGVAEQDIRVAQSKEVIAAEAAVAAAKERQISLEKQILQAKAQNKQSTADQLSLQAQFNALKVQELQGISQIKQELARTGDQSAALRQERELVAAIELRRQALLAAASAAQTASVTDLKNAKQLVGKYGAERDILATQLEIKNATDAAYKAQLQLNKARKEDVDGSNAKEIEAAEKVVNTLINKRILTELEGTEKIRKLRQDIAAQTQLDNTLTDVALQGIDKQVAATEALSKAERGVARDTLATTQAIQAGIDAARRREQEIGAQITAARQQGDEQGAARLVNEQKVAAKQTYAQLKEASRLLTEAGEQLRDNLRGAVVEFTRVRSDPQGLNRFLNSQQRQQRAEFDFQTLLPQFRQAQARFTELTGARAPELGTGPFVGPLRNINEAVRDFIGSVQNEREVTRNLLGVNQAIAINTAELNKTNADLAAKIKELADKDWTINLTQNSSGQWQASGDAKSQAELRAASTL